MGKKIDNLKNKLNNRQKVILDGALGTEIQRRNFSTKIPLWSAECLFNNPMVVYEIHKDYIKAGADIITTNTFSTTERMFIKANLNKNDARKATLLACKLAKKAANESEREIYIAGSIAPLEDCYSPHLTPSQDNLMKEHLEYVKNIKEGKVDFLLLETMITLRETYAALEAATQIKLPVAVSFCLTAEGNLLSGESLKEAVKLISSYNILFLSVNCIQPLIASKGLVSLSALTDIPLGVYANGDGIPEDNLGWKFNQDNKIDEYVNETKKWISNDQVQVVGGCCGTTPQYIKRISQSLS